MTGPYDAGGAMFRVKKSASGFTTETVFVHAPDEWNSEVQTPILIQKHLFAVGKKNPLALSDGKLVIRDLGRMVCLDLRGR